MLPGAPDSTTFRSGGRQTPVGAQSRPVVQVRPAKSANSPPHVLVGEPAQVAHCASSVHFAAAFSPLPVVIGLLRHVRIGIEPHAQPAVLTPITQSLDSSS